MSASVRLDVPLIGQAREMDCWYAAVNMVCKFHVEGPRNGVPSAWKANGGLPFEDFATLASGEHLVPVTRDRSFEWSDAELARVLSEHGPIWAWGRWFGASHIVVITGVDRGKVLINDPDGPKKHEFGLVEFNQKLVRNHPRNAPSLMVYRYPNTAKLPKLAS
jgi:hypothetical protein